MKRIKGFTVRENKIALAWAKKIIILREHGGKCEKCGMDDVYTLEFHHIGEKKYNMSWLQKNGSLYLMRQEADRCIILCRNCHQQLHCNGEGWGSDRKTLLLNILNINSCQKCGYVGNNHACLDFHHINPKDKKFSFSDYLQKPSELDSSLIDSKEKVLQEAKKCVVLCRNCHAIEHLSDSNFDKLKEYIQHKINNHVSKKHVDKEIIKSMHLSGESGSEIARSLGMNKTTICGVLRRMGYKPNGEPGLKTYWRKRNGKNNPR